KKHMLWSAKTIFRSFLKRRPPKPKASLSRSLSCIPLRCSNGPSGDGKHRPILRWSRTVRTLSGVCHCYDPEYQQRSDAWQIHENLEAYLQIGTRISDLQGR